MASDPHIQHQHHHQHHHTPSPAPPQSHASWRRWSTSAEASWQHQNAQASFAQHHPHPPLPPPHYPPPVVYDRPPSRLSPQPQPMQPPPPSHYPPHPHKRQHLPPIYSYDSAQQQPAPSQRYSPYPLQTRHSYTGGPPPRPAPTPLQQPTRTPSFQGPSPSLPLAPLPVKALSSSSVVPPARAPISRVTRACDGCTQKKLRCDVVVTPAFPSLSGTPAGGDPAAAPPMVVAEPCSRCKKAGIKCCYTRVQKKRGPLPGYKRRQNSATSDTPAPPLPSISTSGLLGHRNTPSLSSVDTTSPNPSPRTPSFPPMDSPLSATFPPSSSASSSPARSQHAPPPPMSIVVPPPGSEGGHPMPSPTYRSPTPALTDDLGFSPPYPQSYAPPPQPQPQHCPPQQPAPYSTAPADPSTRPPSPYSAAPAQPHWVSHPRWSTAPWDDYQPVPPLGKGKLSATTEYGAPLGMSPHPTAISPFDGRSYYPAAS